MDLIGAKPRFAQLGGSLLSHFTAAQLAHQRGIALPASIAHKVGAGSLQTVTLRIGARQLQALVGAELTGSEVGALASSPVAVAPLAYAQQITDMAGRITRVFVLPRPGADSEVQKELLRLAAGRLNVQPADFEATLFRSAALPTTESTALFAGLSALVGFLFAFNAMLLTVPRRRALVSDLRLDGYSPGTVIKVLLFDALVLGAAASLLGLVLGEVLSIDFFHANPSYLSFAFPVGSQRIVTWQSIAFAAAGGLLAATVGVMAPLRREIFVARPFALGGRTYAVGIRDRGLALGGAGCLALTTAIVIFTPRLAVVGVASLMVAMLLCCPGSSAQSSAGSSDCSSTFGLGTVHRCGELRSTVSTHEDGRGCRDRCGRSIRQCCDPRRPHQSLRGLYRMHHEVSGVADIWVAPPGVSDLLTTTPLPATDVGALVHLPGVQAVRLYRAGLLDYGQRRVWVLAPPRDAAEPVPAGRCRPSATLRPATVSIRAGGWAVSSRRTITNNSISTSDSPSHCPHHDRPPSGSPL